jgi:hypothetical protein
MADIFSREIHGFLSRKIQLCEEEKIKADREHNDKRRRYIEGQLFELTFFRQYLTDNIDLKNRKYY